MRKMAERGKLYAAGYEKAAQNTLYDTGCKKRGASPLYRKWAHALKKAPLSSNKLLLSFKKKKNRQQIRTETPQRLLWTLRKMENKTLFFYTDECYQTVCGNKQDSGCVRRITKYILTRKKGRYRKWHARKYKIRYLWSLLIGIRSKDSVSCF